MNNRYCEHGMLLFDGCKECAAPKQVTSHTPGPWKVETHNDQLEVWSNNQFIATPEHKLFVSAAKWGHKEANTRLIAAAPDLLEISKFLLSQLESNFMSEFEGTSQLKDLLKLLEPAKQIIAKAEGGEQ